MSPLDAGFIIMRNVDVLKRTNAPFRRLHGKFYLDLVDKAQHVLGYFYDLMDQPRRFGQPSKRGFQMLVLPYKGGEVSMVLMVPRSANGLAALEKKLHGTDMQSWIGKTVNREVERYDDFPNLTGPARQLFLEAGRPRERADESAGVRSP
jgi:hypothetical protein